MKITYKKWDGEEYTMVPVLDTNVFYLQWLIGGYNQAYKEWSGSQTIGRSYLCGRNDPELHLKYALESEKKFPHKFKYSTVPDKIWKSSQAIANHLINNNLIYS